MDATALDLVKGSADSLLEAIVARIGEEVVLVWGFKDDLKDLQKKLKRLNDLLRAAESKLGSTSESDNLVFKDWVKKIEEVAYRAEDVVDEYAYEVLKRKLALRDMADMQPLLRLKTKIRFFCFSRSSNPVLLRFKMAHKVKSLKESIAEVYTEAKELGIKPTKVAAAGSSSLCGADHTITRAEEQLQRRRERVEYEGLMGRDDIKAEIVEQLHQASVSDRRLTVIGVYGMAGCGKTTLCRSIFETTEVKEYFKEQIWICVSHDFPYLRLLNNMVEQLNKQPSTLTDIDAITSILQEKLHGKNFLLVLDDVWNTYVGDWGAFRTLLKDIGRLNGNAILVTSRSREVLLQLTYSSGPTQPMKDPYTHKLFEMTKEDSWSLFKQRVGDDLLDSTRKVELARNMLQKCRGVPLAIITLADLLRSRKEVNRWTEIEGSGIWTEEDYNTLPSIKLSFKYLPSIALKKCFVYCGIFQEDEEIKKDMLIQLWLAQGFLQHPKDEMEQVGEEYFHYLLNNSLFQDTKFDELGNVISCKMHDVVHALAQALSRNNVTQQVRHLDCEQNRHLTSEPGDNLRKLGLYQNPFGLKNVNMKLKYLRALSLVWYGPKELPNSVGELKHLRYFEILDTCGIKCLPDGFTKLYNLQTLRISSPNVEVSLFPKGFNKLVNLRHIYCRLNKNFVIPHPFKKYYPGGYEIGIPHHFGMLTSLRTLPVINARIDWGGRLSELGPLTKLQGRLGIVQLDHVKMEEAKNVDLGKKENINDLCLQFSGSRDLSDEGYKTVLEVLQPNPNVASLEIFGYNAKTLPQWMMEMTGYGGSPLSNLVNLKLSCCERLQQLPKSLENLVALKELSICACKNVISFPNHLECCVSLRKLMVKSCSKMQNLAADITPLLGLREVAIVHCRNMTCLPIGISNLPSLEELDIGPFSPELDMFPFPAAEYVYDHDVLPNPSSSLNGSGCSQLQNIFECRSSLCSSSTDPISGLLDDDKQNIKKTKLTTTTSFGEGITISGQYFKSLVTLSLDGKGMDKVKSLPNAIQYLHQLRELEINLFSGLEALPEWLQKLLSLRVLRLYWLQNLKCLPSQAAVAHLTKLKICGCPLLKEACAEETGAEWPKIKHIPLRFID